MGWMMRGGGTSVMSAPKVESQRRELAIISILISHPTEGLILYETGAGKDYPTVWGAPLNDIFARINYSEDQELPAAIAATGNDIKDVKAIVMGHLHLDHAGGLEHFRKTEVPVYVHEIELKHAFYAVATKADLGVYLPTYLQFDINWQTWTGDSLELTQGITLKLAPGHTPGLSIMVVNLEESGTWIFTTDQYHVRENFEDSHPQGWLARDHDDWVKSHQMIRMLAKRTNAKLVLGHDKERLLQYKKPGKEFYA
ncbi:beta-lactamase-like protein [Rhexocercosporidium sp. MPI-PUGE-AT-0058]|nr:beta-lactamase-like protein [Rhexocercosporidium sp. MPI-PUGE-AT-0058]